MKRHRLKNRGTKTSAQGLSPLTAITCKHCGITWLFGNVYTSKENRRKQAYTLRRFRKLNDCDIHMAEQMVKRLTK